MTAMSDLKMRIYEAMFDVTSVICWANEEEYALAEKFLTEMGIVRGQSNDMVDKKSAFHLENLQQVHALHDFRRSLEQRRPKSSEPPSLKMTIYTAGTGVEMTLAWASEDDYQAGKKFLKDIGALDFPSDRVRHDKPEYFYLQSKEQLESLYEFRQSLREKGKT